jgi:1-acyl-sn-glycerol-3-phosphate acyltransferase
MLVLRSLLFYLGYSVSLVIWATLCLLICPWLPLKPRFRFSMGWNRFVLWWLRICCGISHRIRGLEHVPNEPFVLLSNHQSPWETLFLIVQFQPMCVLLKRELLYIPFFGWALWLLRPIAIDRSKGRSARNALLTVGKQRLQEGLSILVFPEGTRIDVGVEAKYKSGGAELAIAAEARILPVAHNAGVYWPARRLVKYPGVIDLAIGAPIAAVGRDPRELTAAVEGVIRELRERTTSG